MGELSQAPWSRIKGNNVAFKEDQETVGNGKANGQCSKRDNCSFRHDKDKRAKTNVTAGSFSRTFDAAGWKKFQREQKVLEAEVRLGDCLVCRARNVVKVLVPIHRVKNDILLSVYFARQKRDAIREKRCSHAHRRADEQPNQRSKKNDDKSTVVVLKDTRQFQDVETPKSSSILRKRLENLEANPMCSIHQSRTASRQYSRSKTIPWKNLRKVSSSA